MVARCSSRNRASQAGQVLILGLALLVAGGLGLHLLFSAGQALAAKRRLVDTADAAAWSAAVWRARVLNYHAYANRALIANEVAIAQATTLLAWSKYFETLTRNAARLAQAFPPAQALLVASAEAALLARQSAELAAEIDIAARGAEDLGYRALLARSQDILQATTLGFGVSMVAAEVARATHPSQFAWVLPDVSGRWAAASRRADDPGSRQRFAALVRDSLDPFTAGPRSKNIGVIVPCVPIPMIRKRGGTALSDDLLRWEALDTLSLHTSRPRLIGCRQSEIVPLGWGAAAAGPAGQTRDADIPGAGDNPAARQWAMGEVTAIERYSGLSSPMELDEDSLGGERLPVFQLAVMVRRAAQSLPTSMQKDLAEGALLPPDRFPGSGAIWALSAAELYFKRPVSASERVEYASLYNPYWHVRLAAPSAAQRSLALGYVR